MTEGCGHVAVREGRRMRKTRACMRREACAGSRACRGRCRQVWTDGHLMAMGMVVEGNTLT